MIELKRPTLPQVAKDETNLCEQHKP